MSISEFEKTALQLNRAAKAATAPLRVGKEIGKTVKDWMFTPLGAGFVAMDAAGTNKQISQQSKRRFGSKMGPNQYAKIMEQRAQ